MTNGVSSCYAKIQWRRQIINMYKYGGNRLRPLPNVTRSATNEGTRTLNGYVLYSVVGFFGLHFTPGKYLYISFEGASGISLYFLFAKIDWQLHIG